MRELVDVDLLNVPLELLGVVGFEQSLKRPV
jgi:hypothetical protein